MTRTFFIGIQILGFLFFSLGQKEEVKIEHNPPTNMGAAEEAIVTVEIDKSDVSGFAKYQITVDGGINIEVVESAGASFTFNNGKAKFIWMALPSTEEFVISYRILTTGAAQGKKALDSRFSYIYENERKNHDVATHYINVGTAGDQMAESADETKEGSHMGKEVFALADRQIRPDGVNQWRVTIDIEKEGLTGFAKIEETIPEGYTAIDFKSSGAVFSSMDEVIKYIWYDIPESDVVTVSYKLLPVIALNGKEPEIEGTFSYLEGEETAVIPISSGLEPIAQESIKDTAGAEVTDEPTFEDKEVAQVEETTEAPTETPSSVVEEVSKEEPREEIITASSDEKKNQTDANIVDVPQPEEGVFYRVQIAAGKNNLKKSVFENLYNFKEGFKLENHKGWFKYTTGYHQVYKSARDDRERITAKYEKFQGPFVTAYNDGDRISVQEALMVTAQKWYP
ncbi:MAG TPA: hypothetical protein VJ894_04565 [Cryomorphaceae bacterium]|nr:hypothetical protein [Cryomorphaceae bacterium]